MKFEYADLYRFSVSAGIVLLALSFLAPWLLLREPLDVLYSMSDQESLTKVSQGLLEKKQSSLALALTIIPFFSGALILLGISLTVYGGVGWFKLQKIRDKKESIGLAREEHELESMTAAERKEKMQTEIAEEFSGDGSKIDQNNFMQKYYSLEGKVVERLRGIKGSTHLILRERRVGRSFIDILLEPKNNNATSLQKHYIFEVKVRRRISYSDIKSSYLQLQATASSYSKTAQVLPNSNLVFIVEDYDDNKERISKLLDTFSIEFKTSERLNIAFISEKDLESLSDADLALRLGVKEL